MFGTEGDVVGGEEVVDLGELVHELIGEHAPGYPRYDGVRLTVAAPALRH